MSIDTECDNCGCEYDIRRGDCPRCEAELRDKFESWVKGYAPQACFDKDDDGEYIVTGMQRRYLAFIAGSRTTPNGQSDRLAEDKESETT